MTKGPQMLTVGQLRDFLERYDDDEAVFVDILVSEIDWSVLASYCDVVEGEGGVPTIVGELLGSSFDYPDVVDRIKRVVAGFPD